MCGSFVSNHLSVKGSKLAKRVKGKKNKIGGKKRLIIYSISVKSVPIVFQKCTVYCSVYHAYFPIRKENCISLRLLFLGCGIMWKVNIHCCCFTTPFNEAALRLACRSEPFNFTLSDGIVDETSGEKYASTDENKRTILLQMDR